MSQQEEARRALDPIEAAGGELSRILREALAGRSEYRNAGGFIRWGLVERDIKEAYSRALTATAPQTQPEPVAIRFRRTAETRWMYEDWTPNIEAIVADVQPENAPATERLYRGAAPQQWQPIESAPKGKMGKAGPQVLLWAPHWKEVASGWYLNGRWVDNSSGGSYHPTMWAPLPAAPQETESR